MTLLRRAAEAEGIEPRVRLSFLSSDDVAWLASFAVHLMLLLVLAVVTLAIPHKQDELALSYEPLDLPEESESVMEEFISSEEPLEVAGALSQIIDSAALASALELNEQSQVLFKPEVITDYGEHMAFEIESPIFQGPSITEDLLVQGVGTVATNGAVGALDRLTHEILVSVEQRPTLVVWLFDQSGSLREEREQVVARFHRIYEELGVIELSKNPAFAKHEDKPLLTAVVGFGEQPHILTPTPTDQIEEIEAAVAAIEDDASGQENIFLAISEVVEKYRGYRATRNGDRNVMIIVFSDEAGDDLHRAEETLVLCQRRAMPVYVVGRPAPFGRPNAFVSWRDPDPSFDQREQWIPVNMGPETLMPERLQLHFLLRGAREARGEVLDSGYGPYALTRLCYETGGVYFAAHSQSGGDSSEHHDHDNDLAVRFSKFFDPEVMERYEPNYLHTKEYQRRLGSNRACQALVEAARVSWALPFYDIDINTFFEKRDQASFADSLTYAQRAAANMQPKVDQICQILLASERARNSIENPRWQAGYDLAIGRALATKVRVDGYNAVLALAKQGIPFENPESNTWRLKTNEELVTSSLEKLAKKSREYLNRVIEEHDGTPWAMLAQRELDVPFGWKWKEEYTPPRPSRGTRPPRPQRRSPPSL